MMMNTIRILLVAFLYLPLVVAAVSPPEGDVFRFFFRYGFGDGQIGDPSSQPTEEDVKGLMCKTNEFFTDSIRNYTENDMVEFFATEISFGFDDWIYNGTEPEAPRNVPVIVNFTATMITNDGSEVPSKQELWEGSKYFEYYSYIMKYIWEIEGENFFKSTRGIWYEPFIQDAVEGQIKDNDKCPAPATGRGDSFVLSTVEPERLPSLVPSMMPSIKGTPPIASGRFGSLNVPGMGNERPTSIVPTSAPDTPPPDPGRVGGFTMGPTRQQDEMVYFTIQIDFFAGREKEPTDEEINSMMCQTDKFFNKTLQENISPDLQVHAANIHWEWDDRAGLPSMVEFFADATYANGDHVPPDRVFDVMEKVDVKQFVQDYIWMSEPYKENEFYQTEDIFFAGSYTGSANPPQPHAGKIARATCS